MVIHSLRPGARSQALANRSDFADDGPFDRALSMVDADSERTAVADYAAYAVTGADGESAGEAPQHAILDGRYRLIAPLGDGGMGRVYLAVHLALDRRVAIKMLRPELRDAPGVRLRFVREAIALASIEHPNVARAFDLVLADPTFFAMDYVDGPTLADALRVGGPMSIERALAIAIGIARGVGAAHAAGIIHRDLKPANVLLALGSDGREVPRLVDFGIARFTADDSRLTRCGQVVGTAPYMAPEQAFGLEVDARGDVYALGCVLHAMLTGRSPVERTGSESTSEVELMRRHAVVAPPPLGTARPDAPPALGELLARALAKRPEDRPSSMAEMESALAAILESHRARSLRLQSPPRTRHSW